jgi:multiple antibiotic resistance protein
MKTPRFSDVLTITLTLFAVIDMLGNVPVIVSLRKKTGHIDSTKATLVSGILMVAFLFLGEEILKLIGIDVLSFSLAGAVVIFIIGLEMVLGAEFFRSSYHPSSTSIVPIAFPLIAGAGSLTTILSLRAAYDPLSILLGILINLVIIFSVLKSTGWLSQKLGANGIEVLRRVFGIVLLSIAIKLAKDSLSAWVIE